MSKLIFRLLSILTKSQKKRLFWLQFLVIVSATFEVASVLAIGPFMALVGNIELVESNKTINFFYVYTQLGSPYEFLVLSGFVVLFLMFFAAILSILTIRYLSYYAAEVGAEFGDRLYHFYMNKDYLFHASTNSSELVKKISVEISRVTDNVLQPLVQINARLATIVFVSIFVILYDPFVALAGVSILVTAYAILYKFVKNRLLFNGERISEYSRKRFTLMNEGFGSIKEIQVLGRQKYFIDQFKLSGAVFSRAYGSSNSLYNMPRYLMEFIVYSSMVGLILILLVSFEGNVAEVLPVLAVFGIAAFKLLPSFQQMYSGFAQVRSNLSAFNSIEEDLAEANKSPLYSKERTDELLSGDVTLYCQNFKYPSSSKTVLNGINLHIPYKSVVGIIGPSGSGKSTIFDILIGAIPLLNGTLTVGSKRIDNESIGAWQNNIGYVSQMTLIKDGTIAENIAFGLEEKDIDREKLKEAIDMSQLSDWLDDLPLGLETKVGERGVQISGGQRQRIAIARALYNNAEFLFFDEATSALDSITERSIMESLDRMAGHKTVILIAHRLNTVKKCDVIYLIDDGAVKDSGTYNELLERNPVFNQMTGNSNV